MPASSGNLCQPRRMCGHLETETESISLNLHSHFYATISSGNHTSFRSCCRPQNTLCCRPQNTFNDLHTQTIALQSLPQIFWKANHQNVSLKIWYCMRIDRQHLCSEAILPLSAAACLRRHSFSRITGLSSSLTPFTVS